MEVGWCVQISRKIKLINRDNYGSGLVRPDLSENKINK